MSNRDKWMTYPCKTCILKGNCRERCFYWPKGMDYMKMVKYVKENQLEGICLSCGYKHNNKLKIIQWCCNRCKPNLRGEFSQYEVREC